MPVFLNSDSRSGLELALHRDLAWIALSAVVFLGLALGARDLWNPNEPTYGRVVAEMIETGNWLVPHLNGLPFVEKPILYYWLAAALASVFGASEAVLRLPVLAAGVLTTCLTYLLVRRYHGRQTAVLSSALLVTSYQVWWTSRQVQMDSFVMLSTLAILYLLTGVIDEGRPARSSWLLAGVAAGLGLLAKGPVAVLVPGLILLAYIVLGRKDWRPLIKGFAAGILTLALIAAPWYLMLLATAGLGGVEEVLFRQNVTRFLSAWDHDQPWWYYLEYVWIIFVPWAWFLPVAMARSLGRNDGRAARPLLLAWTGLLAPLLFFSLADSKRAPYLLPAAPFVAWIAAVVVEDLRQGKLSPRQRRTCLIVCFLFAALLTAVGVYGLRASWGLSPEAESAIPQDLAAGVGVALILIAAGILSTLAVSAFRSRAPFALLAGMLAFYACAALWWTPALDPLKSARAFVRECQALSPDDRPLYSYFEDLGHLRGGYAYYLGRPLPNLRQPEELVRLWHRERPCVIYENDLPAEVERRLTGSAEVVARQVGSNEAHLICAAPLPDRVHGP